MTVGAQAIRKLLKGAFIYYGGVGGHEEKWGGRTKNAKVSRGGAKKMHGSKGGQVKKCGILPEFYALLS